jgi:uncharacterized OB-fold protein
VTTVRKAAHPGLYDASADAPAFAGTRCGECGATFFPPLKIGCEVCGSVDLRDVTLTASGSLHSSATVHRHRGDDIEAPFTVGEIVLDDGPVIRATMLSNHAAVIGDAVEAQWFVTKVDDSGDETVEPRFGKAAR